MSCHIFSFPLRPLNDSYFLKFHKILFLLASSFKESNALGRDKAFFCTRFTKDKVERRCMKLKNEQDSGSKNKNKKKQKTARENEGEWKERKEC